ncbi:MAG: glycosyltransferase [Rhodanobacteraceae bacterium]
MLGIVVVSYNTSELTIECLRTVAADSLGASARVWVVDNDSTDAQKDALREGLASIGLASLELLELSENVGFAGACNRAIEGLLQEPAIDRIALLNNDSALVREGLSDWLAFADAHPDADMFSARMHRMDAPELIDSLGIAMYASALASNRKQLQDRLVGPTGGLAIYSRALLEAVRDRHGMVFDERFFCYAEDTDLAMRARLLGFRPAYLDRCVALHWGQASSGGGFSDFVLYHGIRNSIWVIVKDFPLPWLLALSPLIVALHGGIVLRHGLGGRWRVVWRLYRDAFKGLPGMWRSRRVIQRSRAISLSAFGQVLTPRFYDRQYLRQAWRELWRGRKDD